MIAEVIVVVILIYLTSFFIRHFMPDTDIDLNSLGRWTVITGATDGIGKAFAHEVAKRGFDVFLVSRSLQKLDDTASEIRQKYGVSTKVFQVDFSEVNKKVNSALKQELQNLEIGLLINNVGTAPPHQDFFTKIDENHEEHFETIVNTNVMSAVNMTRFVLPGMLKAGKGLIVNVSSMLSECPCPLMSLYGASKSFLTKFSTDLDLEVRHKGVHVHALNTGLVATKLSGSSASDLWPPCVSPDAYAKSALISATKWRVSSGHVLHAIPAAIMRLSNAWLVEKVFMDHMLRRRKKNIKDCPKCNPKKQD